ncbi:MAG: flavodoxin-dependent (E)-4-hydroxy-3-methylbut-2-enyl-diphosphate synthase [Kiritimatiellia bacterium]|nr:flavodoxin-dependent (E)-4-hydroxy-3-methylbut-2-enyl-diphosphate synthase [Kiritimatiellia bacterium]
MHLRTQTRTLKVGNLPLGGGAPVSVQTMANIDPHDGASLSAQIARCAELGCDLYRLTIPDVEAAKVLGEVRKTSPIPLVSDIHFDYRCALAAIEAGTDALRLNPGNIGSRDRVQAVARAAKGKGVPIRIGVNFGSLEKDLDAKVRAGTLRVSQALCASALGHLKLLEDEGFRDVVISVKASNVQDTLESYRLLAERTDCPLHVGVTEAGTFLPGAVRNSVALGILLSEGIGDTIRVSLTDQPEKEVRVGMEILRSLGLKAPGPAITSCPTCGRTKVNLFKVAAEVESALEAHYNQLLKESPAKAIAFPHVAVMGCVVNGPGEAKGADVALCGGDGEFVLFVKGEQVARFPEAEAVRKVLEYVVSLR